MKILSLTSAFVFLFSLLLSMPAFSEDCVKSMQALCGKEKNKAKCLEKKKTSLSQSCRSQYEKTQKLASQIKPECIKAMKTTCPLDFAAIRKDQSKYMVKYQKCIKKNLKLLAKTCKSMKAMMDKNAKYSKKK